jgi:hypothetical protein
MAVYQGARPTGLFPGRIGPIGPIGRSRRAARTVDAPALPRRRVSGAVRAKRRSNRVGIVLGAIVLAFLLAFFSLAQTMRVSATGYEIDRLAADHDALISEQRQLVSDISRLGGVSATRRQAIDLGLTPLTNTVVVPAR